MGLTSPNWKTGEGYPPAESSEDRWLSEFLARTSAPEASRPFFRTSSGPEFFRGPAIICHDDSGAIHADPDSSRLSGRRMVIEFHLDEDLDPQIERAAKWLKENQAARFSAKQTKTRAEKYVCYLRVLDATRAGADDGEIASFVFPHIRNEYPDYEGRRRVRRARQAADVLLRSGQLAKRTQNQGK